ncbi:MAG: STAS domain-containing protein, partial [Polyangiaceae bacterium]|nr:STAS domain-containing protein [Polyangiaceae bacterium]
MEVPARMASELDKIRHVIGRLEENIASVSRGETDIEVGLEFPLDHPVGALEQAIAETIAALAESKRQRARQELELETRIRMIRDQQSAILELSSPVIEVWRGILTLPIVGVVDADRATAMTSNLLDAVTRTDASLAIIDLTGVHGVAADVCDHILRMTRCVQLIGSQCALSGMRPEVARTIAELGYDLGQVKSYPTLRSALTHHVRTKLRARHGASPR